MNKRKHTVNMQQNLPFNFNEVFKLTNLGLNPELFKFGQVTFESQKYICIKDAAVSIIIIHVSLILTIFLFLGLCHHRHDKKFRSWKKTNESWGYPYAQISKHYCFESLIRSEDCHSSKLKFVANYSYLLMSFYRFLIWPPKLK